MFLSAKRSILSVAWQLHASHQTGQGREGQSKAVSFSLFCAAQCNKPGRAGRQGGMYVYLVWLAGRTRSISLCFVRSNINGQAGTTGPGNRLA